MLPTHEFPAFRPHPLLPGGHLMTIATRIRRRDLVPFAESAHERVFRIDAETRVVGRCHFARNRATAPVAILVHGLAGCADSGYMIGTAYKLVRAGFDVVRLNVRNCGGTESLTPTLYHSGLTDDVLGVMTELIVRDRAERVYLVGFSMGGNMVFKAAAELGGEAPDALKAIVGVSPAIDLAACAVVLDDQLDTRPYRSYFLRHLKQCMRNKARAFPGRYDLTGLDEVRNLRGFDDLVTAPAFGFADHADYYARASSLPHLERIRVPALAIHAENDPVVPASIFDALSGSDRIGLHLTRRGGHCAFIGAGPAVAQGVADDDRYWVENRVVQALLDRERELGGAIPLDSA